MAQQVQHVRTAAGLAPVRPHGAYWVERFNAGGVACGLINNVKEMFEEPQIQHLGMVKEVVSKHHGAQRLVGQPMQLTRTPSTIARAAPKRGEHSEEILREIGLQDAELAAMKSRGVY
jgi:formyl-CoA transferase